MKKRRIKGIQMIPYGLLAGVMTEDSIEERQREVRLTEISSEGFRMNCFADMCHITGQKNTEPYFH